MVDFPRQLRALLPRSVAFRAAFESKVRAYLAGLSNKHGDIKTEADLAYLDLYPSDTRELEEWERQFGLPGTGTDAERRVSLAAEWQARGGQSPSYLQSIMQAAGFDVYAHDWWEGGGALLEGADLYLNADSDRTVTAGGTASVLGDDSGNETDATQTTPANEPAHDEADADFGGRSSVEFDGVSTHLSLLSYQPGGGSAQFTVYMAVYPLAGGGRTFGVFTGAGTGRFEIRQVGSTWELTYGNSGLTTRDVADVPLNELSIIAFTVDASDGAAAFPTVYVDGALDSPVYSATAASDGGAFDSVDYGIGALSGGAGPSNTKIGTILVYDGELHDDAQMKHNSDVLAAYYRGVSPTYTARDPRDHTNQPTIGSVQCGETDAQCGETGALCNRFLANEPGYIVNLALTDEAPPSIPDDSALWPYFAYWGGASFLEPVVIYTSRRAEFERLMLKIHPAHLWLVTRVVWFPDDWTPADLGGVLLALDSAFGVTADMSNVLTAWEDQGPNAEAITVNGSPPFLPTSIVGGAPFVDLRVAADNINAAAADMTGLAFVAIAYYTDGNAGSNANVMTYDAATSLYIIDRGTSDILSAWGTFVPSDLQIPQMRFIMISVPGDIVFNDETVQAASSPSTTLTGMLFGSNFAGTGLGVYLGDVVLATEVPSEDDVVRLREYWRAKYGI